jgi:hypothetical protein
MDYFPGRAYLYSKNQDTFSEKIARCSTLVNMDLDVLLVGYHWLLLHYFQVKHELYMRRTAIPASSPLMVVVDMV